MMYVSKKESRINNPVVLKVKLEVVSRPGVLFTDCNATRRDAQIGKDPNIVRFDITQAKSVFAVPEMLRHFYQAEVFSASPSFNYFPKSRVTSRKATERTRTARKKVEKEEGNKEARKRKKERLLDTDGKEPNNGYSTPLIRVPLAQN